MNCREAQTQIFAAQNGAPADTAHAELEGHVAHCAACRQVQANLAAALGAWRHDSAQTRVPDTEREWHAVRRRIRGAAEAGAPAMGRPRGLFTWLAFPLGTAAATAIALLVVVQPRSGDSPGLHPEVTAYADYVEAPGNNASTMVIVDDKTGWIVVLASDAVPTSG